MGRGEDTGPLDLVDMLARDLPPPMVRQVHAHVDATQPL